MNFNLTLPNIFPKVMVANIYILGTLPHFREFGKFQSTGIILKAMTININGVAINIDVELFLKFSGRGIVSLSTVDREI